MSKNKKISDQLVSVRASLDNAYQDSVRDGDYVKDTSKEVIAKGIEKIQKTGLQVKDAFENFDTYLNDVYHEFSRTDNAISESIQNASRKNFDFEKNQHNVRKSKSYQQLPDKKK